jgi:TPP-dependent pyruvate/acetoin dehydrogenase alpha subunit
LTTALDSLQAMMLIRAFETALARRRDHGFQLLSTGEEAVAVGLCSALTDDDQLLTGGRSIGPALARGIDPGRVMAELLGRVDGINRGKAGRGHMSDPDSGFFGAHAVVGGNITIAAGVALSRKMAGEPGIVAILFGDGACGQGSLHEALNIAALWRLPLLFVCNNNQLSVSTPRSAALAPSNLSDLGTAYGIPSRTVDGLDFEAVVEATGRAAATVRAGHGPVFLEFTTLRLASHSTTARETRSRAELAALWDHCPIRAYQATLSQRGLLSESRLAEIERSADAAVARAVAFADASSYPTAAEATTGVY